MKHLNKQFTTIASILIFSIGINWSCDVFAARPTDKTPIMRSDLIFYEIGDTGPAGGIVIFVDSSGLHGIEVAPDDASAYTPWTSGATSNTEAHGGGIGAGKMNTMLIIANQGDDSTTYAAGICANSGHSASFYNDWYLPSVEELRRIGMANQYIDNICLHPGCWYWSSTELDIDNACGRNVPNKLGTKIRRDHRPTDRSLCP